MGDQIWGFCPKNFRNCQQDGCSKLCQVSAGYLSSDSLPDNTAAGPWMRASKKEKEEEEEEEEEEEMTPKGATAGPWEHSELGRSPTL